MNFSFRKRNYTSLYRNAHTTLHFMTPINFFQSNTISTSSATYRVPGHVDVVTLPPTRAYGGVVGVLRVYPHNFALCIINDKAYNPISSATYRVPGHVDVVPLPPAHAYGGVVGVLRVYPHNFALCIINDKAYNPISSATNRVPGHVHVVPLPPTRAYGGVVGVLRVREEQSVVVAVDRHV